MTLLGGNSKKGVGLLIGVLKRCTLKPRLSTLVVIYFLGLKQRKLMIKRRLTNQ